ncbi:MAG: cytochrome P450 [Bacteroidota bacterium]
MSQLSLSLRRRFFWLMRGIKPSWNRKEEVWLFRDEDVREVLERDKDFTLRPINATTIERRIGAFLLSRDDGAEYQHEVGVMRSVVHREDLDRIRQFTRTLAREICEELSREASFDVVSRFTRMIPLRLLGEYFGAPGPDDASMLRWNRSLFWDIFLNQKNEVAPIEAGEKSAAELNGYLKTRIAELKASLRAGEEIEDTLLSRLVHLQQSDQPSLDDDGIRRTFAGTLLGAEEPIAKACVNILNQFFHRPRILAQARDAAAKDDMELVSKLAFEAFRFHPNLPVIIRYSEKNQWLGEKRRFIPKGKKVYALISSAMFDKRRFAEPSRFRIDRPREDYLYFGHGLHTCYGNYINYVVIPEMLAALLRIKGLRPATAQAGTIQYEGTFPQSWLLTTHT